MREPDVDRALAFGEFELDFRRSELRRAGALAEIRPTPLRVLLYLAEHRDRTVPRAELLEAVWPGVIVSDEALTTALKEARQAVGDDGAEQRVIRTLKGIGYRFVANAKLVTGARATSDESETRPDAPGAAEPSAVRPQTPSRRAWSAVAAGVAIAAGFGLWLGVRTPPAPAGVPFGIAVLPVATFSREPADRELADGLTEQITHALSRNGYPVVARTTAAQWRERAADVRELGRLLGVSHVLEGSVRRGSERVRVTLQLVASDDGKHVWSETFDVGEADPLATQDRVTDRVALQVYKFVWEDASALRRDPRLAELSELVVADRRTFVEGRWTENLAIVERILALAPEREPFLGWRGSAHGSASLALANLYITRERTFSEVGPELLAHAERGAALLRESPAEAMARAVLARAYGHHWRWADAEREMGRACEIDPLVCANIRTHLCPAFGCSEQQLADVRRLVEALPMDGPAWAQLSLALFNSGELEAAEAASLRAHEVGGATLGRLLPHVQWQRGRRADAVRNERMLLSAVGAQSAAREIERLGASSPEAAWRWLAEQARTDQEVARPLKQLPAALFYAELGGSDAALSALERSIAAHEAGIELFGLNPTFDAIRETPRFRALIERMGLTSYHEKYRARLRSGDAALAQP